MARQLVGALSDFEATGRVPVHADGHELVVFRLDGEFVAYANACPHMGGPVCEGKVARKIDAYLAPDGAIVEHFSETELRLVCPWHGFEFDITDGVSIPDGRYVLRRYEVERDGDLVYVRL
jgi:nitrite reductase/ring-hydroxylating ferredoxin subunit